MIWKMLRSLKSAHLATVHRDTQHTSLTAHMRAMEPMLLVIVTKVALARSSLDMLSLFSLLIMCPKL